MIWCNNVQSDCLANFAHEAAKDRTHMDELPASCHGDGMPCGVLLGPCFHSGHLLWFQCYFAGSELEGSGRRAYTNMALPGEIVQEYRLTNAPCLRCDKEVFRSSTRSAAKPRASTAHATKARKATTPSSCGGKGTRIACDMCIIVHHCASSCIQKIAPWLWGWQKSWLLIYKTPFIQKMVLLGGVSAFQFLLSEVLKACPGTCTTKSGWKQFSSCHGTHGTYVPAILVLVLKENLQKSVHGLILQPK